MTKKTRSPEETLRKVTSLQHALLSSVRGGIGPGFDPGNETGWIPEPNGNEADTELRGEIIAIG